MILVTGASGFVGRTLVSRMVADNLKVRACVRNDNIPLSQKVNVVRGHNLSSHTDWRDALENVDVIIHLAARVHVMQEHARNPLAEFRKVNVDGTVNLALQAAKAGVKRFVYVSSVKVNGESTDTTLNLSLKQEEGRAFTEVDAPNPQDAYGVSKWEAEQALHKIAAETGLEVVIVRPPLVYGAGVKGNFAQMIKVLVKGLPLPLASVQNLRSLIYVENLVDALILCATHPAAAGQTYLVSDGEDISTSGLLCQLGDALKRPVRLFFCPSVILKLSGRLIGKSDQIERLLGSLQIDSSKIRHELGWNPPFSLQNGLIATVQVLESDK